MLVNPFIQQQFWYKPHLQNSNLKLNHFLYWFGLAYLLIWGQLVFAASCDDFATKTSGILADSCVCLNNGNVQSVFGKFRLNDVVYNRGEREKNIDSNVSLCASQYDRACADSMPNTISDNTTYYVKNTSTSDSYYKCTFGEGLSGFDMPTDHNPTERTPISSSDAITTDEDIEYTGILNASDLNNDTLTYSIVTNGTKGIATITNANTGAFTYTPNPNENGDDNFTFKVNDGTNDSNTAAINVTINPISDLPIFTETSPYTLTLNEDNAATASTTTNTYHLTLNASDSDGDTITWTIETQAANGIEHVSGTGTNNTISYTPNVDYSGNDNFTVQIDDGNGGTNTLTVDIIINPINDIPTKTTISDINVFYGDPSQTINLDDYFADIDNAELTYSIVSNTDNNVVATSIETNILTLDFLNAGTSDITVTATDLGGLSVENSFTVSVQQTTTSIEFRTISPTPSIVSQEVYIPFTVTSATGSIPTGTVNIVNVDESYSCSRTLTESHNGQSGCYITFNEEGDHEFTARYEGDTNHTLSTSNQTASHQVSIADIIYTTTELTLSEQDTEANAGFGSSLTYTVELSTLPTSPVEIVITPDAQVVINERDEPISIYLSDTTPVEIIVTAIDDAILEENHSSLITHTSSSTDIYFDGKLTELNIDIVDNEAGIVIEQTDSISGVIEGDASDNYTVVLTTEPSADVTVNLNIDDNQIAVYPTQLIFTSINWDQAQNVRISAVDNQTIIQGATIVHSTTTADTRYASENVTFVLDGETSDTISVSIIDNDSELFIPISPSGLSVSLDANDQAILTWQDNSSDESQFILLRNGQILTILVANTNNYIDDTILCDTVYQYQIYATNAAGDSPLSNLVSVDLPCLNLQMPTDLAATIFETEITLTWTDNNSAEIGYQIIRNGQVFENTAQNAERYTDINVQCGTQYDYLVSAIASDLSLSPAASVSVTTKTCAVEQPIDETPQQDENIQNPQAEQTPVTELPAALLPPPPVVNIPNGTDFSQTANIGGQTVSDITIQSGGSVSNGTLDGEITNRGLVSNITIEAGATITGGSISGTNINYGTMQDVMITAYSEVSGGIFKGKITNRGTLTDIRLDQGSTVTGGELSGTIQSQGTIFDVDLNSNARVIGGQIGGFIQGNKSAPAYLGNIKILDGAKLEYVQISPTTQLPDNIEIGEGVIFPSSYKNPSFADFGIDEASLNNMDAETLQGVEPTAFGLFDPAHLQQLSLELFAKFEPEDINYLQAETVAAISLEQFEQLPLETLSGFTADNVDALSSEVLAAMTVEQLNAIQPKAIQQAKQPAKIFTQLSADNISPAQLKAYLPQGWEIDDATGKITTPVGTKLTYKNLSLQTSATQIGFPEIADLSSSFSLGGTGGTSAKENLNLGLQQSISLGDVDLSQFIFTQNENGVLNIVGEGEYEGITFAFLAGANGIEQAPLDIPVGLSQDEGGFFTMVTSEQQQFFLTPSSNDPVGLVSVLSGEPVEVEEIGQVSRGCEFNDQVAKFNESGDVLLKVPQNNTRRTRIFETDVHVVTIFDSFVEPAPNDFCFNDDCDWEEMPDNLQQGIHFPINLRALQQAYVVYPDGSSQIVYPTVLYPVTFEQLLADVEGVEKVIYQTNGSFKVTYLGQIVTLYPSFDTFVTPLINPTTEVNPSIELQDDGTLDYTVQDCTRLVTTTLTIE